MAGKASRPACPGGQHSLQFRSSLIFSTFSKHMEGQRKLRCGHTSETSVSATWPLGADALTHRAGNTRQWPGSLASQPSACICKESSERQPPLEPKPTGPPPRIPEAPGGALPQLWKQQRTEVAKPLYLSNTSQLLAFFFLTLFKLKLSKVVPDKSEGFRGSGLSFLLLMTSAKD